MENKYLEHVCQILSVVIITIMIFPAINSMLDVTSQENLDPEHFIIDNSDSNVVPQSDINKEDSDYIAYFDDGCVVNCSSMEYENPTVPESSTALKPYGIDLSGHLAGDWVMVSYPYDLCGNIATIFNDSSCNGSGTTWDIARWYDPLDTTDPWKTYNINHPANNDMPMITNYMGVWLHLTEIDCMLSTGIPGAYPGSIVEVPLHMGWNLVGFPSMVSMMASDTLPSEVDTMAVYHHSSPYIRDTSDLSSVQMSEGNAYWVHATSETIWVVIPIL